MGAEKIEHRAKQSSIANPDPQRIGREASQRQQTLGTVLVRQHPDKRPQRQCFGIGGAS